MLAGIFRKLPPFKGKSRLVSAIFARKLETVNNCLIKGKRDCQYILPNIKENVGFEIFFNGIYEEHLIDFLKIKIPKDGRFLDIGANIGAISLPLAKERSDIGILAIEAAPQVFEYLDKNVRINGLKNIEVINYALHDSDEDDMNFYSPDEQFGKGSFSPVFTNTPTSVRARRLDTILQELGQSKVDVIKIDVEGFEYFVFKGAERLLSSKEAPSIVLEFVDWAEENANELRTGAAQELLFSMNYKLYIIDRGGLVEITSPVTSGACDLFATKKLLIN